MQAKLGQGINQQKTSDDVAESFGVGRCILLSEPLGQLDPFRCTYCDYNPASWSGPGVRISYQFDGMRELFALLADKRLNEVAMPVLGAGHRRN